MTKDWGLGAAESITFKPFTLINLIFTVINFNVEILLLND